MWQDLARGQMKLFLGEDQGEVAATANCPFARVPKFSGSTRPRRRFNPKCSSRDYRMKAFTREIVLIVQSVLFWMAALPIAFLAWPVLLLGDKARNLASFRNPGSRKPMAPQWSYR